MGDGHDRDGVWRRLLSPTSQLTREGRARRRFNCGKQGEWDERAEAAMALLQAHREVLRRDDGAGLTIADFGAGNERLRDRLPAVLPEGHEYHPFDLHPQLPTTQRLDVAAGLPDRHFDLAICLGLLEYLPSVPPLARSLHDSCRFALVSYVTSDSPVAIDRGDREAHAWTTHLGGDEVEAAFAGAGFAALGRSESDGRATRLWLWRAKS
jgi:hypothetical protein